MVLNQEQVLAAFSPLTNVPMAPEVMEKLKIVAVAKACGYACPMPSSPVVNLNSYWIENCRDMVEGWVSNANEYQPFNVRLAIDVAFQVFRMRYNVLHVPQKVDCHELVDAMIRTSGCNEIEGQFKGYFEQAAGDHPYSPANSASRWLFQAFTGE